MRFSTTVSAILTLGSTAIAHPGNEADSNLVNRWDNPNLFRLTHIHTNQQSCIPGSCMPVSYDSVNPEGSCSEFCDAPATGLSFEDSLCDQEIDVCGRKIKLVKTMEGHCRRIFDLNAEADNGLAYAEVQEDGKNIGLCAIDLVTSEARTCQFAGGSTFNVLLVCSY